MSRIGVLVLPGQKAIPNAFQAFTEDGKLKEEKQETAIAGIGSKLAITIAKLSV